MIQSHLQSLNFSSHTFASFHYDHPINTLILTFFIFQKNEWHLCVKIFWYVVQQDTTIFSSSYQGGPLYFFIRNLPRKVVKCQFLNSHHIQSWEFEPLCKNEWLRRWGQNLSWWCQWWWVSTHFPTFLAKKVSPKNIVIWVLKPRVLRRQTWWYLRKICKNSPNKAFLPIE